MLNHNCTHRMYYITITIYIIYIIIVVVIIIYYYTDGHHHRKRSRAVLHIRLRDNVPRSSWLCSLYLICLPLSYRSPSPSPHVLLVDKGRGCFFLLHHTSSRPRRAATRGAMEIVNNSLPSRIDFWIAGNVWGASLQSPDILHRTRVDSEDSPNIVNITGKND